MAFWTRLQQAEPVPVHSGEGEELHNRRLQARQRQSGTLCFLGEMGPIQRFCLLFFCWVLRVEKIQLNENASGIFVHFLSSLSKQIRKFFCQIESESAPENHSKHIITHKHINPSLSMMTNRGPQKNCTDLNISCKLVIVAFLFDRCE